MAKRIVYQLPDGTAAVMTPALNNAINDETGEWLPLTNNFLTIDGQPIPEGFRLCTVEDIAAKDVPAGRPFKIVDTADLPQTRAQRHAWEFDPVQGVKINPNRKKPFRDQLREKFAEVIALHTGDLTDVQLAEVVDRAETINSSYGEYEAMLGKEKHKKVIIGSIKRMTSLPASKDSLKQSVIDFVEANYPL